MSAYKVLVTDDISPVGLALLRDAADVQVRVVKRPERAQLLDLIGDCQAVITRSATTLDAGVFAAAPQLKVAGRAGVGLDNVDVDAATRAGVLVMNTPDANTLAATEHTFALLLALCRNLPDAHASLKAGEWQRARFMGVQLFGKTLAVIGFGRIGSRVAARAQAFGMEVIAYDPYIASAVTERAKVALVPTLEEALACADFITVHMPLTAETRRLIGTDQLAHVRRGARLVNCARGELIDETALLDALESGALAGAALDVFSEEPPRSAALQRLIAHERVIATPHIAASTLEAQEDVGIQIARQVLDALRGENYQNAVNLPFPAVNGYRELLPYLRLAEAIGSLHAQLSRGPISRVEIALAGEELSKQAPALTVALVKGLLTPILGERLSYVNALRLAQERGIQVMPVAAVEQSDYSQLIATRVLAAREQRAIAGTLFGGHSPRIVQIDEYRMDGTPEGRILVMTSLDVPGVIGHVGTLLGERGINIAEWHLGRTAPGGRAMSFINVDDPVSDAVLDELRALPQVQDIRQVVL